METHHAGHLQPWSCGAWSLASISSSESISMVLQRSPLRHLDRPASNESVSCCEETPTSPTVADSTCFSFSCTPWAICFLCLIKQTIQQTMVLFLCFGTRLCIAAELLSHLAVDYHGDQLIVLLRGRVQDLQHPLRQITDQGAVNYSSMNIRFCNFASGYCETERPCSRSPHTACPLAPATHCPSARCGPK